MALAKSVRLAIIAKLKVGTKPKDVAEQLDVNVQTVYGIARELKEMEYNDHIIDVHAIPDEVLHTVVEKAKQEIDMPTPEQQTKALQQFDNLESSAEGLKALDKSFQSTITAGLGRFDEMLKNQELPLKDIIQIMNTSANTYEKIFNSGVNVHIGDNNTNNNQLTMFKNKQGV